MEFMLAFVYSYPGYNQSTGAQAFTVTIRARMLKRTRMLRRTVYMHGRFLSVLSVRSFQSIVQRTALCFLLTRACDFRMTS